MILGINFSFFYTNILLIYCMYQDIKYRKISNKVLIGFLLIGSVLTFTEELDSYKNILIFVLIKLFFLFFVFFLSFILFSLKMIGGADGKLMIMLAFLNTTHRFMFEIIFSYFFVFLFLYLLLELVNYFFINVLSRNNSYSMIYGLKENFSFLHKMFFKFFYRFLDFSHITRYKNEKFVLRSLNLFYNEKKEKFQVLTQFKPPVVILIFLTNNYMLLNFFCLH
ncbi:MAG: prepilin peptidase [Candidatus Hermodarchaeota archaeon]